MATARAAPSVPTVATDTRYSIVFVVTSMHGGGAEYVGRAWMSWLSERGHSVSVITTSSKRAHGFEPDGVTLATVGDRRSHRAKILGLRASLRAMHPDVVVSMQSYPNLLLLGSRMLSRRSSRPAIIVSERNLVSLGLRGAGASHRFKHWLARKSYRYADHVIAVSHPVAGEMVSAFGVPGDRVTVVPNPSTAKMPAATRTPDGLDDANRPYDIEVVLPSRLVAQKRPELAVRAAHELAARGLRVRIVLFGEGPLLDDVRAVAAELGVELDIRGWSETWYAECSEVSVVVLPSLREGFGNVLVEAAAAGIPSVASSASLGVADALVPGLTGELALDDHPVTIADAIVAASRITIGDLSGWLDHFSLDASGAAFDHVVNRVLRTRKV